MTIERAKYQACITNKRVFWVTDPGHGWLAVPLDDPVLQHIAPTVSSYSYIGGGTHGGDGYAFLEEDCDAGLYINVLLAGKRDVDFPEFTFDQPRCANNVAANVRGMDAFNAVNLTRRTG